MKISYIIVAFNSDHLIEDCIKSIIRFNNKLDEFEIIVVDNSFDEKNLLTKYICDKYNYIVKYIPNQNLGYGNGNNIGINLACGEIICIINPDVRFLQPFLNDINALFQDTNTALVGFKQLGGSSLSFYLKPEYAIPLINSFLVKICNKFDFFCSRFFFLSGACFFISKNIFMEIGYFDENIFMYHEESDISNRLKNKNYKIKYIKNIKYDHLIGDRTDISIRQLEIYFISLKYYLEKYKFNVRLYLLFKKIELFVTSNVKLKQLIDLS